MPWVEFTENFDWMPHPRQMKAYKAGTKVMVPTPCADRAVALGKGKVLDKAPAGLKSTKAGKTVSIQDVVDPETKDAE